MNSRLDAAHVAEALINARLNEGDLQACSAARQKLIITSLMASAEGRRWLRAASILDRELSDQLLSYQGDYNRQRHDATLAGVIDTASLERLEGAAVAIASGSGATAFWARLASHPPALHAALDTILQSEDGPALEATATHLLLDAAGVSPLSYKQQRNLALALLSTGATSARGIAAEFLATSTPATLASRLDDLARDPVAAVRGYAWLAAFRTQREAATEAAIALLGDEAASVAARRSALNAAGETLPTNEMVNLLSYFVAHPNFELASDAADLFQRHHRHPDIALAAASSPHVVVRDIAVRLMDPFRGSPAAGGSRPGDPLRTDPLIALMRQLEEETEA